MLTRTWCHFWHSKICLSCSNRQRTLSWWRPFEQGTECTECTECSGPVAANHLGKLESPGECWASRPPAHHQRCPDHLPPGGQHFGTFEF